MGPILPPGLSATGGQCPQRIHNAFPPFSSPYVLLAAPVPSPLSAARGQLATLCGLILPFSSPLPNNVPSMGMSEKGNGPRRARAATSHTRPPPPGLLAGGPSLPIVQTDWRWVASLYTSPVPIWRGSARPLLQIQTGFNHSRRFQKPGCPRHQRSAPPNPPYKSCGHWPAGPFLHNPRMRCTS